MFSLCRCDGSCNSVEDPSGRMSIANIIKDVNWKVFNITRWINGSKTSMNYTSCEYRCKFDGKKFKPKQKWNKVSVWVEKSDKTCVCKEDYTCNPRICAFKCDKSYEV